MVLITKAWIEKKSINLLSSSSLVNIYIANVKELSTKDSRLDKDFLFHILMCSLLVIGLRVYIGEEDQHELYFFRKRLKGTQLDQQTIMEEVFGYTNDWTLDPGVNEKFIEKEKPLVITVNYIPKNISADYIFLTKGSRYKQAAGELYKYPNLKIIATSNVECRNGKFDYIMMREPLLERKEQFVDNSFLMLLKILKKIGTKKIACAGFDGYSNKEENYAVPAMEYDFIKGAAEFLNRHIRGVLEGEYSDMEKIFVTYSHYCEVEDIYSAAY